MPIFTNNDLHAATPPRVRPRLGEWGPIEVPATRAKKRTRVLVWVGMALAVIATVVLGWYFYSALTGAKFLGLFDLYG